MPKDHDASEQYTPKGHKIPVPTRGEFDKNLDKLVKSPPPPRKVSGKRQRPATRTPPA